MTISHDGHRYVITSGSLTICDKYRGRGVERMRELIEKQAAISAGFINRETGDADVISYRAMHNAS